MNISEASELSLPWKKSLKSSFLLCLGTRRGCVSFSAAAWDAAASWGPGGTFPHVGEGSSPPWSCGSWPARGLLPALLPPQPLTLPQHSWPRPEGGCLQPSSLARAGHRDGQGGCAACALVIWSCLVMLWACLVLILLLSVVTGGDPVPGCVAAGMPLLRSPRETFLMAGRGSDGEKPERSLRRCL